MYQNYPDKSKPSIPLSRPNKPRMEVNIENTIRGLSRYFKNQNPVLNATSFFLLFPQRVHWICNSSLYRLPAKCKKCQ
jgi:hypothetical protein